MSKYQRFLCAQAIMVLASWYSLKYAWGLEPKNMGAMTAYFMGIVIGWPIVLAWVQRGSGDK